MCWHRHSLANGITPGNHGGKASTTPQDAVSDTRVDAAAVVCDDSVTSIDPAANSSKDATALGLIEIRDDRRWEGTRPPQSARCH